MPVLRPKLCLLRPSHSVNDRIRHGHFVLGGEQRSFIRHGSIHGDLLELRHRPQCHLTPRLARMHQHIAPDLAANDRRHDQALRLEHWLEQIGTLRSAEEFAPARAIQQNRHATSRSLSSRIVASSTGNPLSSPLISSTSGSFTSRIPCESEMAWRRVPDLMPSRLRNSLGITIWYFEETVMAVIQKK